MQQIDKLLYDNIEDAQKFQIFLKTMQSLNHFEKKHSYKSFIDDLIPVIGKIISNYSQNQKFSESELQEYTYNYQRLYHEYLKYQIWLIGTPKVCRIVRTLFDYSKVHLCGESTDNHITEDADYIYICSEIDEEVLKKIEDESTGKIVRYDILRDCGYQFSAETRYLDIKLRQKIENGAQGAVTGLSYVQKGLNFDRLQRNIACLAAPAIDLYLDYHNFKWFYREVSVKKKRPVKYCILGMDFYRLWYDMSLSQKKQIRILSFYNRLKCIHHLYPAAEFLLKSEEDSTICEEIMIKNYMDADFEISVQPSSIQWTIATKYISSKETYVKDSEEVKKVFNKPYPLTFKENNNILERYLKFLISHEIKTLIYIPPFPKIFNDFTPEDMKQTTYSVLTELQHKYHFDLLDLSTDTRFVDEHFADWSHLNVFGADLATDILNEHMDKIWGNL